MTKPTPGKRQQATAIVNCRLPIADCPKNARGRRRRCCSIGNWQLKIGNLVACCLIVVAALTTAALAAPDENPLPPDPYAGVYGNYRPGFLKLVDPRSPARDGSLIADAEAMKLSREKDFYTLSIVDEQDQAYAIVEAARKRQAKGETREAMKVYQLAIERYPHTVYRVSDAGVFVTVSQYCQRRILQLPPADLAFYRAIYDGAAKEAFEQARRQYSLVGFQEIVDTMLATSRGDNALAALGDAALDAGDVEEALERYRTIRALLGGSDADTPELALKIELCLKRLGRPLLPALGTASAPAKGALSDRQLAALKAAVEKAVADAAGPDQHLAGPPCVSAGDTVRLPPPTDEMALDEPVWSAPLPGARGSYYVFTHPLIVDDSVLYRHKNIVTCRSILNGEPRWTFDTGGRVTWQSDDDRMYPPEELVVSDGIVFTNLFKAGPSLAALDLITGQLRWASGPMAPATRDDTRTRYEAAPAIGPRTIYCGYVKDNIEGDTHFDTVYGVRAFDAATGRVLWDTEICRLAPGKFTTGVAVARRNRIRSFTSPPVLHQGTLYYNTNAGTVAAINARSGSVEWAMRYPYWPGVHDATRPFGSRPWWLKGPHLPLKPMGWYPQRPLVLGDRLIVAPADSPCLMSIDRATGKVGWTYGRPDAGHGYLLGPTSRGELVLAFSGRAGSVKLLDAANGQVVWDSPDPVKPESSPTMTAGDRDIMFAVDIQDPGGHPFWLGARPMLTADDRLYVASFEYIWPNMSPGGWVYNLAGFSLSERKLLDQRRYYDAGVRARAEKLIREEAPKELEGTPPGPKRELLQAIANDQVPENAHGPFRPFSRLTFDRYGVRFELRTSPDAISMCYDRPAVVKALAAAEGPRADFARAELALAESRFADAAELLQRCLRQASPDDLDFRSAVNQQLHRVQLSLSQTAIRQHRPDDQVAGAQELYRRANTVGEEVGALLALAEAYEQAGSPVDAARCLQNVVRYYAGRPYGMAALARQDPAAVAAAGKKALDAAAGKVHPEFFTEPSVRGIDLLRAAVPLYESSVSPLPRTLTIEAGPLATARLLELAARDAKFAESFGAQAVDAIKSASPAERIHRVQEFPGTPVAGEAMAKLFAEAARIEGPSARRAALWRLGEIADLAAAAVPKDLRDQTLFSAGMLPAGGNAPLAGPMTDRTVDFEDPEGGLRMVLARHGDRTTRPELLLVGGRAKKRLDNKFELACVDLRTGKKPWVTRDLRLKGSGQEPGFTEAFVRPGAPGLVIVHGFYDVLAFSLLDGSLRWRYEAPLTFEIAHATAVGDLLVLSGANHTIALYVPTDSPTGEVVWSAAETGEPYAPPYAEGERLVSLRRLPSNVTVRRLGTGRMLGRLDLPDLSQTVEHPLVEDGPEELPVARLPGKLFVTDGWYTIAIDTERLRVLWKRLIENNDPTREPPMRLSAGDGVLLVLKKDYQAPAMIALEAATGNRLWRDGPDNKATGKPVHSAVIAGGRIYGLTAGAGRSFNVHAMEAATGKELAKWTSRETYQTKPQVTLWPETFGGSIAGASPPSGSVVARVQDNQTFELIALDGKTCQPIHVVTTKGVGPWDTHGRVSATVQDGRLVLMNAERAIAAGR